MVEETKKAVKMERIYADYEDKFVKAIMLYADDSNNLYYDADKTNAVLAEDLETMFISGLFVRGSGYLLKPDFFSSNNLTVHNKDTIYYAEGSIKGK